MVWAGWRVEQQSCRPLSHTQSDPGLAALLVGVRGAEGKGQESWEGHGQVHDRGRSGQGPREYCISD